MISEISNISFIFPPSLPDKDIVFIPLAFATIPAFKILAEFPDVLIHRVVVHDLDVVQVLGI